MKLKFDNEVSIKLISGKTGETLFEETKDNAISDDLLCSTARIFTRTQENYYPYCFILPDGPNWTGFTYDRSNPWAPYCTTAGNSVDNAADNQIKGWNPSGGFVAPVGVLGRTQLNYQWTALPQDFQLKAIGLTAWQDDDVPDQTFGMYSSGASPNFTPEVLIPQTLVVLPTSVLVHGRNLGAETPDILQISYFLSIVGTS